MTKLRKAAFKDFEVFKSLYLCDKIQCMYTSFEQVEERKLTPEEENFLLAVDEYVKEIPDTYESFNFDKYIEEIRENVVLIYEENHVDKGYFVICNQPHRIWRIIEWGVNPPNRKNRENMLRLLFEEAKRAKRKCVEIVTFAEEDFLKDMGFNDKKAPLFFRKEI